MQEKVILSLNSSQSQGIDVLRGALVIGSLDDFWKTRHFHFPQSPAVAQLPPELLCKSKQGQPGINFPLLYSGNEVSGSSIQRLHFSV